MSEEGNKPFQIGADDTLRTPEKPLVEQAGNDLMMNYANGKTGPMEVLEGMRNPEKMTQDYLEALVKKGPKDPFEIDKSDISLS